MPNDEDRYRMLARIAAALGLSVRDFYAGTAFDDHRDLSELLHLWERGIDRQGRARVLELARQEALRCRAGNDA